MKNNMYYDRVAHCWMHRSLLKIIVNPILRKIQFWTKKPWVITSNCVMDENDIPHFLNYCFDRVECLGPFKKENCDRY
jgi:hypothetical protein